MLLYHLPFCFSLLKSILLGNKLFCQDESVLPTTLTDEEPLSAFSSYFLPCILLTTGGAEEENEQLVASLGVSLG